MIILTLWTGWAVGLTLIVAAIANKGDMHLFLSFMGASVALNAALGVLLLVLFRKGSIREA